MHENIEPTFVDLTHLMTSVCHINILPAADRLSAWAEGVQPGNSHFTKYNVFVIVSQLILHFTMLIDLCDEVK